MADIRLWLDHPQIGMPSHHLCRSQEDEKWGKLLSPKSFPQTVHDARSMNPYEVRKYCLEWVYVTTICK